MSDKSSDDSLWSSANNDLAALYHIHDDVCYPDKEGKRINMQNIVLRIEETLRKLSPENADSDRAKCSYIIGKAKNCFETFSQEAEVYLTRAVKLDPNNVDAWLCLGECYWKKDQKSEAHNCFLESVKVSPTVDALHCLSMISKQLPTRANPIHVVVEDSIKYAKQALAIDVTNAKSWYILGNALSAKYFSVTLELSDIHKAVSSYQRAEACYTNSTDATSASEMSDSSIASNRNPDLYYNKGNLLRYLQDYSGAVSAYGAAIEMDVTLTDILVPIVQDINAFSSRLSEAVLHKGKVKAKRLDKMVSDLIKASGLKAEVDLFRSSLAVAPVPMACTAQPPASSTTQLGFHQLLQHAGTNTAVSGCLNVKVVLPLPQTSHTPPECYLCVDSYGTMGILAVYIVGHDSASVLDSPDAVIGITGSPFQLVCGNHPTLPEACKSGKETSASAINIARDNNFAIVQVFHMDSSITINNVPISKKKLSHATVKFDSFDR